MLKTLMRLTLPVLVALFSTSCTAPSADNGSGTESEGAPVDAAAERAAVDAILSEFHRLASQGDFGPYFELFTDDAVFMGTDASERWSVEDFRGYASASDGWTYDMTERHIFLDAEANTAWFDERLENARYGETRGTGVLVRTAGGWKITQYNLTIPVPNELALEFVERIRERGTGND
jgi:ketosteroid isomerase-like protein